MEITVEGIKIFYERNEGEGEELVILHGWGANSDVMRTLYNNAVQSGRNAVVFDFPYFGKSEPPPPHYSVYDYAHLTYKFLKALGINTAALLGHSFGGRIAIILAASYPEFVSRLILIDAAGVKPKRGLKYKFKVLKYKIKKLLRLKTSNAGSADYRSLPQSMKGVFVRVVNENLEYLMPQIKAPSLLIWGRDDKDTPLYMAQKMNKLISDSGLVILENAGHFSFLDRSDETNIIIDAFFRP